MSTAARPDDDIFARASEVLRQASREEKLNLLRRAGVLADEPRPGDKVVARDLFGDPHFGVVVGVDRHRSRWMVLRSEQEGVELAPLEAFAAGGAVELVERAPAGEELSAVMTALDLRNTRFDFRDFRYPTSPRPPGEDPADLAALLATMGLSCAAEDLSRDAAWGERTGRYRDHRGRPLG